MARVLDGKALSEKLGKNLKEVIQKRSLDLTLLIIQVGDRPESNTYIKHKKNFASNIGVQTIHQIFPLDIKEESLVSFIEESNSNNKIQGIIVQLPLPGNLDKNKIIESIDPKKDVDGGTSISIKNLFENKKGFLPATTRGILTLLESYGIPVEGKRVVVIGRSTLVGKPTAISLINHDATVTLCHSKTENLASITREADILVSAAGVAGLITKEFVREGQTVIDVGINFIEREGKQKMVGDVLFDEVEKIVSNITPVPGGVGPMTILSLFQNLLENAI